MIGIIGIVIIFAMVFGGYVAAGGKMGIILKSLPFEMIMIGGRESSSSTGRGAALSNPVGTGAMVGGATFRRCCLRMTHGWCSNSLPGAGPAGLPSHKPGGGEFGATHPSVNRS